MSRTLTLWGICALFIMASGAWSARAGAEEITIKMETSLGDIILKLDAEKAPKTTANFMAYAKSGYYDQMIFHRIVPRLIIQGGGYTERLYQRTLRDPVVNEADNGLKHHRGSIAMARQGGDPHSATSQFFINLGDNKSFSFKNKVLPKNWGYAVFGYVAEGMEVVDAIAGVKTELSDEFDWQIPVEPVMILSVNVVTEETATKAPSSP